MDDLTPEELEALRQIARGLSNAEIALETGIDEELVRACTMQVFQKLRLRDRVQAVVYAYEHGIVHAGENGELAL